VAEADRVGVDHPGTGSELVEIVGLEKYYPVKGGILNRKVGDVKAVDGVDLRIREGETLGLVGESGCGKSTLGRALLRLIEPTGGTVTFDGEDVTAASKGRMRELRREMQIVFQDAASSLNPRMRVGDIVAEPMEWLTDLDEAERRERTRTLIEDVGLSEEHLSRAPHTFSGGQQQRISIARALSVDPRFIVCDEPTSALDVSVQAKILNLLDDLQDEYDLTYLVINHDMSVVRHVCDRVAVMYLGKIVEVAPTDRLFADPKHPYTRALLSAVPRASREAVDDRIVLGGSPPSPENPPSGCRFHTRCPAVIRPEDYEFDQTAWRAVIDLRQRLDEDELGLEAIRERVAAESESDDEPDDVPDHAVRSAIRTELGLPETLGDPAAETTLEEGLTLAVDGEGERASDLLASEFATVCEEVGPPIETLANGRRCACHLYD
jgi:oligopeptide/dipeptide ABC transporter ATP-binding protein